MHNGSTVGRYTHHTASICFTGNANHDVMRAIKFLEKGRASVTVRRIPQEAIIEFKGVRVEEASISIDRNQVIVRPAA